MSEEQTFEEEVRSIVEEFVSEYVIPRMDKQGQRIVEDALNSIVMPKLAELDGIPNQVETNTRAIAGHDVLIQELRKEQKAMIAEIKRMPNLVGDVVRAELEQARVERNAERYEQLSKIGWKLAGAAAGSSVVVAALMRIFLGG